jgi:ATP-dependent Lon protease
VRKDVGMTGEITLRGRILPVGGVREKVLSAYRVGLKTVILPKRNDKDLVEVPKQVRAELEIVLVENMDQVLDIALMPSKTSRRSRTLKSGLSSVDTPAKSNGEQPAILPGV